MKPITEDALEKFEENITKPNEIIDLELPRSVIKVFSEIWQLWMKYPAFKVSLESEEFRSIYTSMASYFVNCYEGADSCQPTADYVGVCDICDSEIPLKNNDVNLSMRIHEESPNHVEVMENFRKIEILTETFSASSSLDESLESSDTSLPVSKRPEGSSLIGKNTGSKMKQKYYLACKCFVPPSTVWGKNND